MSQNRRPEPARALIENAHRQTEEEAKASHTDTVPSG
jgi:hypothetical protein